MSEPCVLSTPEAITLMVLAPLRGYCPSEITYFAATPFFATHAAEVAPMTYLSTLTPRVQKPFSEGPTT